MAKKSFKIEVVETKWLKDLTKKIWKSSKSTSGYWLTRFVFLRFLGLMYFVAFISLATQVIPLIGDNGLLPADNLLSALETRFSGNLAAFVKVPTVFLFHFSDKFLLILAWAGVVLSAVILVGFANGLMLLVLWFLYMSFIHIGQVWYGYGWEFQLLETGFLAIFLTPFLDPRPFPRSPPPPPIIWLLRWLTFRIYLGAGLIKIRGAKCWRDLTCLFYYYETQPIPNPLSPWFHFLPKWIHKLGVAFNHFVELVVPFFIFSPRKLRHIAGILLIGFQIFLIVSGNLSFLNWLTIAAAISAFDDSFWRRILPKWITRKAEVAESRARLNLNRLYVSWILLFVVAFLSIPVILNLLSPRQAMNTSFDRLHLVNTYGAFGAVGKERNELIIEGTAEEKVDEDTKWKEYEFKAKPGDPLRRLPIVAPYQPRIDWQIWFAAMQKPSQNPWLTHLVWKLLENDPGAVSLIANNPFMEEPPKNIRIELFNYKFAKLRNEKGAVWERKKLGTWLPPLSKETPELQQFIKANNWGN